MMRIVVPGLFSLILFFQGCGMKPPGIPEDVTKDQILDSLYRQSDVIKDFSGWARVIERHNGLEQSATAVIRFIAPDRIRIIVKGFAGIELAAISSVGDSMTVFIPSLNGYVTGENGKGLLRKLIPDFDFDVSRFASVFSVLLPPHDALAEFQASLKKKGNRMEIALARGDTVYRYLVEGPLLLVAEEDLMVGGTSVWQKKSQNFQASGAGVFPKRMTIRNERHSLDFSFYSVSINSGLSGKDIVIEMPDNAERLEIRR
jgi:hypothetical protein